MSTSSSSKQKELVAKIYSVHERLRAESRLGGEELEEVWERHTKDEGTLKEYSEAMSSLAQEIWEPRHRVGGVEQAGENIKCRLDWVNQKCQEYFNLGGQRKLLNLLDVGSCYNPFTKFGDVYNITAIDLWPAPGVHKCDFLKVKIGRNMEMGGGNGQQDIVSLPEKGFDIVVFSFFLEYLPDRKQRLESCRKAWHLLSPGGLLFVLRPDSSNPSPKGNSRLMKGLKVGLGFIGFKRIYFEKLEHLWCAAFVKLNETEREEYKQSSRFQRDANKVEEHFQFSEENLDNLFCISQDFKDVDLDNNDDDSYRHQHPKFDFDTDVVEELPNFVDEDDSDG